MLVKGTIIAVAWLGVGLNVLFRDAIGVAFAATLATFVTIFIAAVREI